MHLRRTAAAGTLLLTCGLVTGIASPALAVCDAYSGNCASPAPTVLPTAPTGGGSTVEIDDDTTQAGTGGGGSTTSNNARTLPFTGGELVLLTAVGAGALAGGTALVVAGRRKSVPST